MGTDIHADVEVQRFGYVGDEAGQRLLFPRAELQLLEGRAGTTAFGAAECALEELEGRLDTLRWTAEAASVGATWLRNDAGTLDIAAERAEMPHGVRLVRAAHGVELLSPHVTFSELRLAFKGPFGKPREPDDPAPTVTSLRQEKLRFLDSLSGRLYLTIRVRLDLPVLGKRSLDQPLKIPIQDGSIDFRALEDSLDWLEGQVLDFKHEDHRLKVRWKVPIFGSGHDLITWPLDNDATTLASFGRVPVRSLVDFQLAAGGDRPDDGKKRKVLQSFAIEGIDVALSLLAPKSLEVGGGMILFGGDDQPGLVDLKATGELRDKGEGVLRGAIGSIDTTIKDLHLGGIALSADRLHFDGLDQLEIVFDGFTPVSVALVAHRMTATNLALTIGG